MLFWHSWFYSFLSSCTATYLPPSVGRMISLQIILGGVNQSNSTLVVCWQPPEIGHGRPGFNLQSSMLFVSFIGCLALASALSMNCSVTVPGRFDSYQRLLFIYILWFWSVPASPLVGWLAHRYIFIIIIIILKWEPIETIVGFLGVTGQIK